MSDESKPQELPASLQAAVDLRKADVALVNQILSTSRASDTQQQALPPPTDEERAAIKRVMLAVSQYRHTPSRWLDEAHKGVVAALRAYGTEAVANFLEATGQYVTNDASRQAAIDAAVAQALATHEHSAEASILQRQLDECVEMLSWLMASVKLPDADTRKLERILSKSRALQSIIAALPRTSLMLSDEEIDALACAGGSLSGGGMVIPVGKLKRYMKRRRSAAAASVRAPEECPPMPEHWSVTVDANGDRMLSIGDNWIAGANDLDESVILGAAKHLLSFIGYGLPDAGFTPPDDDAPTGDSDSPGQEASDDAATMDRLSDILTRTANALRGDPGPLRRWSWHDLPERAAAAIAAIDVMQRVAQQLAQEPTSADRAILIATIAELERQATALQASVDHDDRCVADGLGVARMLLKLVLDHPDHIA